MSSSAPSASVKDDQDHVDTTVHSQDEADESGDAENDEAGRDETEAILWDGDADEEWVEEDEPCRDLFSTALLPCARAVLERAKQRGFDVDDIAARLRLDFVGRIRLVNFVRGWVREQLQELLGDAAAGQAEVEPERIARLVEDLLAQGRKAAFLKDDKYMIPVIEGDSLLCGIDDDDEDDDDDDDVDDDEYDDNDDADGFSANFGRHGGNDDNDEGDDSDNDDAGEEEEEERGHVFKKNKARKLERENAVLKNKVEELEEMVANMSKALRNLAGIDGSGDDDSDSGDDGSDNKGKSKSKSKNKNKNKNKNNTKRPDDKWYFQGYSSVDIHEEMLRDHVRTLAYRDMIEQNPELVRGKTVLDVGCGSGILCMFAARAGAKRVIGVDLADIVYNARDVVRDNGLDDVITLVKGRMEEVELPVAPGEVDFIVSEWMGYFLLFESMLPSVLFARDHYLNKETGIVCPSSATMFICAAEERLRSSNNNADDKKNKPWSWQDVYGFDMRSLIKARKLEAGGGDAAEAVLEVDVLDPSSVLSDSCKFFEADIMTVADEELDFNGEFEVEVARDGSLDNFTVYFDVGFDAERCAVKSSMTTSPLAEPTHWKQTLLRLPKPIAVKAHDKITGDIIGTRKESSPREYDVYLSFKINGAKASYHHTYQLNAL